MQHDLTKVDEILDRYPKEESSLVMVLQDVQSHFRFLPCEALQRVAQGLSLPRSRVFSVATFYKAFSLEPRGRVVIQVCKGTACHVGGAQLLEDELCRQLDVSVGGTTSDRTVTLQTVNCVGACAMAPVVIVGERYHGEVKPSQVRKLVKEASSIAEQHAVISVPIAAEPPAPFGSPGDIGVRAQLARQARGQLRGRVQVCGGTGCLAAGARDVHAAMRGAAEVAGLPLSVEIGPCQHARDGYLLSLTGCQGLCQRGPLVHLLPGDILYTHVKKADAEPIVEALTRGEVVERLLGEARRRSDNPFYQGQTHRVLTHCGAVDPEDLDDYLAAGGFAALAKAVAEMSPEQVLESVEQSGLRGRGGAGFPTARKWRTALRASSEVGTPPYVLCNGDEGDPGAFMDCSIMEGAPFQVLEGMILGAFALGARQGYVYVRNEYPRAVTRLQHAIRVCRQAGLLGDRVLGSSLRFDVQISRGGGAFVCGESTALMRSLEGKVGEPRAKYVRSAERGLHDAPTVLNNVETWALVPGIVLHGPAWLSTMGTERSKGTKAFSLAGQVRRTGLVEVPMGTTLRHLIFDVGGGVLPGHTFKAVQTGGPSGGCLPESQLDLPVDFDALTDAGSMMGSGGMVVMDERTCMVDVAKYFVNFLKEESCGKCSPCRLGLQQLSHLLGKVTGGEAVADDIAVIAEIAKGMAENSLCGLGKSAPTPVLSTLRYFGHEYEAHLRRQCPAGVCRKLIRYEITSDCIGCLLCIKACPTRAITGAEKQIHTIDQTLCDRCGICRSICNHDAVAVMPGGGR